MTIKHHLDEATLMAYAAGSLPEAFNLIIATHLSLCDTCRAASESYDAVGGALVDDSAAAQMSQNSLQHTLARLDVPPPQPVVRKRPKGVFPAPLQDYVGGDLEAVKWRAIGMGVKQAILPTSDAASARLLCIPAGKALPDHSHKGTEITLVLQGAFADEGGIFARGDVEVADTDVSHIPIAQMGADCVCLIATDAPLRFKGWMPRMMQRFARI